MLANEDKFRIFTGNANPDLAREIAAYLGTTVGDAVIRLEEASQTTDIHIGSFSAEAPLSAR